MSKNISKKGVLSVPRSQRGFTIIELMLAMLFVSFILIFMSLTIVQMLRIYDKAVSMKQVNQAGRSVTEDISEAMRSQSPEKITTEFVSSGLLCVGPTVYRWNPVYSGTIGTTLAGATPAGSDAPVDASGATMVRKVFRTASTPCTIGNADSNSATMFQSDSVAPMLSSRSRVIWASAQEFPAGALSAQPKLVELSITIGTYSRSEVDTLQERGWLQAGNSGSYSNFATTPHREIVGGQAKITCLPGNDGNFCSFAEFKTTVYVSKDQ